MFTVKNHELLSVASLHFHSRSLAKLDLSDKLYGAEVGPLPTLFITSHVASNDLNVLGRYLRVKYCVVLS